MVRSEFKCRLCSAIFRTRGQKNCHVRISHQLEVKVKFMNDMIKFIRRDTDGKFRCLCDLSFQSPNGIHRHAKRCRGEATTFVTTCADRGYLWRQGIGEVCPPNYSTEAAALGTNVNPEPFIGSGVLPVYLKEFETVICLKCGFSLQRPPGIGRHLISKQGWGRLEAKKIKSEFHGLRIRSPADRPHEWIEPKPENPPVPHLKLYEGAFGCPLCDYVCVAPKTMRNHLSTKHRGLSKQGQANWRKGLWVQTFHRGASYFEVGRNESRPSRDLPQRPRSGSAMIRLPVNMDVVYGERIRELLYTQIQQQMARFGHDAEIIKRSENRTEINLWLERTRWIDHLSGCNLNMMAKLVDPPKSKDERMLQLVCGSLDRLLEIARQSLINGQINHFDSKQINSFMQHKTSSKPLNVNLMPSTFERYKTIWQRLLCYVIRTSDPVKSDRPLYKLTDVQMKSLKDLIMVTELLGQIPECDPAYVHMVRQADRSCLKLCIALLDHQLYGDEYHNTIISFLAVLAIDPTQGNFRNPTSYTGYLSGMIKGAQLLVIKASIQAVEDGSSDYPGTALEEMQSQFMTFDGRTPMAWALGLRAYGKKLIDMMTTDGDIIWSDDCQSISYKDFQCSLSNFRSFVRIQVTKAQEELAKLFLIQADERWNRVIPEVRLTSIKDIPGESRAGWNFLKDERNRHLFDGTFWMIDRITRDPRLVYQYFEGQNDVTWQIRSVRGYLSKVSVFLERLLLLAHITAGQPARSTEILGIRDCNTLQGEYRNIFIENGLASIVTTYHKSYAIGGTPKIIHRYLPREVTELLVYYLWLIMPFKHHLESLALKRISVPNPILWCADNKQWDGGRIKRIFERESNDILKSTLNIRSYRHVAIAMARKHLQKDYFEQLTTKDDNEWDLQAAHKTNTAGAIYARSLHDAPGFVESRRETFRRISREWHLFLGFKTWERDLRNPCPAPETESSVAASSIASL